MRILFVSFDIRSRFGGIQRFDQRVVRCLAELDRRGDDVEVLSLRDAPAVPADEVTPLAITGAAGSKGRLVRSFLRAVLRRPDVILYGHVLLTPLALLGRILSPRSRTLLFTHGIEVWNDPSFVRVSSLNRIAVRKGIDRVLAVSRFTADRLIDVFALDPAVVHVFMNAVDVAADESRGAEPLDTACREILTVARLDEWEKGIGSVLRALPEVIEEIGPVRYAIVGDGRLRGEMEALAAELGVEEHVRFAGRVSNEELNDLYHESQVFVMPSAKEGFGIVYLEAWQHGLPVIAGNRDAGAEVVEHEQDGLVVDPTDTREVATAIVRLLKDRDLAKAMAHRGREKLQHYSHERFRDRLWEELDALLDRRPRA